MLIPLKKKIISNVVAKNGPGNAMQSIKSKVLLYGNVAKCDSHGGQACLPCCPWPPTPSDCFGLCVFALAASNGQPPPPCPKAGLSTQQAPLGAPQPMGPQPWGNCTNTILPGLLCNFGPTPWRASGAHVPAAWAAHNTRQLHTTWRQGGGGAAHLPF